MLDLHFLNLAFQVSWELMGPFLESQTPVAEAVTVAGEAVGAAALAAPALLLGGGLFGWQIGTQIRKTFFGDDAIGPPSTPFLGGQGLGTYHVVVQGARTSTGIYTIDLPNIQGPVGGITATHADTGFPSPTTRYGMYFDGGRQTVNVGDLADDDIASAPSIISITPNGAPDAYKNPIPQYDPLPYPPGILTPTIPFPFLPGNPEYPSEIVPFRRPGGTPEIPATEPGQEEEPKITINIPDLGFTVDFKPGGVEPRQYNPQSYPERANQSDPKASTKTRPPTTCECECDLSDVVQRLKDIKDEEDDIKDLVTPPRYRTEVQQIGGGQGGTANLPPLPKVVRLTLQTIPSNARKQFVPNSPDVFYCGWYAFGSQTIYGGERIPVAYQDNTYIVPEGATTFTWGLYDGFSAIVRAYYNVKESN